MTRSLSELPEAPTEIEISFQLGYTPAVKEIPLQDSSLHFFKES